MSLCRPLPRWLPWTLAGLGLVVLLAPIVILWLTVWQHPSLSPFERKIPIETLTVVDIRDEEAFERCHIPGAIRLSQLPAQLPAQLFPTEKPILVVCGDGLESVALTKQFRAQGRTAFTLEGGMSAWIASAPNRSGEPLLTSKNPAKTPWISSEPLWKQWLLVLSGYVLKPIYMFLTLLAAWLLRSATSPGLVAVRRSLWCFFAGEAFCAIDYLGFGGNSFVMDWFHNAGMVAAISFGFWAVMVLVHQHLLGEDGKPCIFQGLCQPCTKLKHCRIDKALPLTWGTLALLACVPFTVEPIPTWASLTTILGSPFAYTHDVTRQLVELRYLPLVGFAFLFLSLPWVLRLRNPIATVWLAAAAGPIIFGCFRMVLVMVWRDDPVWFPVWEEIGEFANILALWWWMPAILRSIRSPTV